VSDKHKFLTAVGDTYQWVEAKNLTLEMNIVAI
jgi:hypothetical protein